MNTKVINVVKCFDPSSPFWRNDREHNKLVVEKTLEYCYEIFRAKRYLFLNEVYERLSIPFTRTGQVAGWIYNGEHMHDHMWTVWTKDDGYDDVYITFEPISNILDVLPEEEL